MSKTWTVLRRVRSHSRNHHQRMTKQLRVSPTAALFHVGHTKSRSFGDAAIVGYLCGVARPICGQQPVYSGWKRSHVVKYQSVVTPDGKIRHHSGTIWWRRRNATVLRRSVLLDTFRQHFTDVDRNSHYLYGHSAYPLTPWLMEPFRGGLNPGQSLLNRKLRGVS